jgi:hypothetical protein
VTATFPEALVSAIFPHNGVVALPETDMLPMVVMVVDAQVSGEIAVVGALQLPAPEKVTVGVLQPRLFQPHVHAAQSRVSIAVSATAPHVAVNPDGHDEMHVGGSAPEYACIIHALCGMPLDATQVAWPEQNSPASPAKSHSRAAPASHAEIVLVRATPHESGAA